MNHPCVGASGGTGKGARGGTDIHQVTERKGCGVSGEEEKLNVAGMQALSKEGEGEEAGPSMERLSLAKS